MDIGFEFIFGLVFKIFDDVDDETQCRMIGDLLSRATERALSLSPREIENLSLPSHVSFEIASAQSELFRAAIEDSRVLGIGFNEEHEFPIPRSEFPIRAMRPTAPNEAQASLDWRVSLDTIIVTSPNFERQDSRKWKGRLSNGSTCLFDLDDEHFWQLIKAHGVEFTEDTKIGVHLASRYVDGRVREQKVIRVLSLDSTQIAKPLNDDALQAILGQFTLQSQNPKQKDLFT